MKFTNGYWLDPEGMTVLRAKQIRSVTADPQGSSVTVRAPAKWITTRGDTLNAPEFTITYTAVADGVIKVSIERLRSLAVRRPLPPINIDPSYRGAVTADEASVRLSAGELSVVVPRLGGWEVRFEARGRAVTASEERAVAHASTDRGRWTIEQLSMTPGERIYGLGERFGAFTKNGQSIDIWNEDGGTCSEQAYKNVSFYLSSRGYGVYVLDSSDVSFEIASEMTTRAQFSVPGDRLEYLLIDGPAPKDVLRRYTALTGRPPRVPAWSYGLWLTTSFTTSYDEATVTSFVDGMADRGLPLSVFHFDCFWMREFHWCDFVWDPRTFPDPEAMLARLKAKGLRICVWINPYIAQRSHLYDEGAAAGYLVRRADGGVWQTDLWQSGMALVDFTNPEAVAWYRSKLKALLDMGVDCFKTDFGERIPVRGIVYHDGSDPVGMHNHYTYLYNRAVFGLLREERGEGEAVLFARSATAGGQAFPVHWGGDCTSTHASMGETLRGGLSLAMSGFGYWSHDIGGVRGDPRPRRVQTVAGVRAPGLPLAPARVGLGARPVGLRLRGRGGHPVLHAREDAAHALHRRRGARGHRGGHPHHAPDGPGVPRGPGDPRHRHPVHAGARRAGGARVHSRRQRRRLPARGGVDAAAGRPRRLGAALAQGGARFHVVAAVRARRHGAAVGGGVRPPRLRLGVRRDTAVLRAARLPRLRGGRARGGRRGGGQRRALPRAPRGRAHHGHH